jgi:N-formylglutamate deformylase
VIISEERISNNEHRRTHKKPINWPRAGKLRPGVSAVREAIPIRLPFAISVPHGSHQIPEEIVPTIALSQREILESTDMGAREVFTQLPVMVTLWSRWSRLVVDLNRDSEDHSPRGVVPLKDYHKRNIYKEEAVLNEEEIERRLKKYYWPYHYRLQEAIKNPKIKILFDCHSLAPVGPAGAPDPIKWRKDIVLANNGNRKGEKDLSLLGDITCPSGMLRMMKDVLRESGFSISVNQPYTGGFITTHYGHELIARGKTAVQMEINQQLYVDEEMRHLDRFRLGDVSNTLQKAFREIARRI